MNNIPNHQHLVENIELSQKDYVALTKAGKKITTKTHEMTLLYS